MHKDKKIRISVFLLMIFQSVGYRIIEYQGFVLGLVIMMIIFIVRPKAYLRKELTGLIIVSALFGFLFVKSYDYAVLYKYCFILLSLLCAFGYLGLYSRLSDFEDDFYQVLKIIYYHFIVFFVILLYRYMTDSLLVHHRLSGFFWEPSIAQLFLNLYIFYSIRRGVAINKLLIPIVLLLFTFSSTGYILLFINVIYYYWKRGLLNYKAILFIGLIIVSLPIIISNLKNKLNEQNTSFMIRLLHYEMGIDLIKNNPLLGVGITPVEYYYKNDQSYYMMREYFDKKSVEVLGLEQLGMTNSYIEFAVWFGLPVTLLFTIGFVKQRLIVHDRKGGIFFIAFLLLTSMSVPILITCAFLIYPLSCFFMLDEYYR